jgi:putative integral membrane protein (TIGR02587 family)
VQATWQTPVEDSLRGIGGGLVLGLPLLYTMEVWWLGETATSARALAILLVTVVPVSLLVRTGGFREQIDVRAVDILVDTIVAIALGVVAAALVLFALQRVSLSTPWPMAVRMVVFEAAPFAVGAAIGRELFRRAPDEVGGDEAGPAEDDEGVRGTLWDLGATAVGAMFIASSIAPTDEVTMLTAGIEPHGLIALVVLSLLVSYGIVFLAGFSDQEKRRKQTGVLQHPLTETVVAYVVSLIVAAGALWFFDKVDLRDPAVLTLHRTVVLGFPAAIGGAAGRIVA